MELEKLAISEQAAPPEISGWDHCVWWATLIIAVLAVPAFSVVVTTILPFQGDTGETGMFVLTCWTSTYVGIQLVKADNINKHMNSRIHPRDFIWWATLVVAVIVVPSISAMIVVIVLPMRGDMLDIPLFVIICWACTYLGIRLARQNNIKW